MKKLNKLFLAALMVGGALGTTQLNAQQHEVKTNVAGLLFNQFGLTYEYILAEEMGLQLDVAYFTPPAAFAYDYTAFSVAPEFRYYFNPDDDADGYFAGGYLKYRNTSAGEYTFDSNGDPISKSTNGVALGITGGRKWVTRMGLTFEGYTGIGRYLFDSTSYGGDYQPTAFDDLMESLPSWDWRIGVVVGWRFGR